MKEVELTQGKVAMVDDADFDLIQAHNWHTVKGNGHTYASGYPNGEMMSMHRFLLAPANGKVVTHLNRNGLDNRRENLQLITRKDLWRRTTPAVLKHSRFRGVTKRQQRLQWVAFIWIGGSRRHLGSYRDEEDAARAYDAAAREHHGVRAKVNFPEDKA